MLHRLPTLDLRLLGLVVALVLLSHDAVMATGPHDRPGEVGHAASHEPHVHDPAQPSPRDEHNTCGALEAARTSELTRDIDGVAGLASPVDTLPVDGGAAPSTAPAESGMPPARLRALLQVWLN